MPKGKIKNPGWITCKCQYCEKNFNIIEILQQLERVVMNVFPKEKVMMLL